MRKKRGLIVCFVVSALLLCCFSAASAHTTVTVGPYNVEIGWLSEPPIIGQMNAIVMNLSTSDGSDTPVTDSISNLALAVSYGGQTKTLTLQPLGEDTPGQYVAPILPTIPGLYTVDVNGTLGSTAIKVNVQPEEVQAADVVQFPQTNAGANQGGFRWQDWIGVAALVLGLIATAIAIYGARKPK
jgi:hypothetical protein